MRRSRIVWLIAAVWAVIIFFVSSLPARRLPTAPWLHHDKALHAILFAPLGALCLLAVRQSRGTWGVLLVPLAGLLAGMYGITDELHQFVVPGRTPDVHDVLADWVGGTIGALITHIATTWWLSTSADR